MTFPAYTPKALRRDHPVAAVLGVEASSLLEISRLARQGFPRRALDHVGEALGLPRRCLAPLLGVAPRTLERQGEHLSPAVSDHLFRLAHLVDAAERFHGGREAALRWLQTPNLALGDVAPLEAAHTEAGTQAVLDLLGGLEHGVIQ